MVAVTVGELIARLSEYPADRQVILGGGCCWTCETEFDPEPVDEVSTEPDTVSKRGLAVMLS